MYELFYKGVISKMPEQVVEVMGEPFYRAYSAFLGKRLPTHTFNVEQFEFSNPIGIPSGWADTPGKANLLANINLGVIVLKTITVHPQRGNPYPRIIRKGKSLINSMGLPNKGLQWWKENIDDVKVNPKILSVKGNTLSEWKQLIDAFSNKVDILELNFSCPNVSKGVMDIDNSIKLLKEISKISNRRYWLKLSPEHTAEQNLELVQKLRSDILGVTLINTLPVKNPKLGNKLGVGGFSGPEIYPLLIQQLTVFREYYRNFNDLPIFATGGVDSSNYLNILKNFKSVPLMLTSFLTQGLGVYGSTLSTFEKEFDGLSVNSILNLE